MTSKATKIFVSYSQKDRKHPAAIWILKALKSIPNLRLWMDDEQIWHGAHFVEAIGEAIRDADYMIRFLSKNAPKSPWANIEYELAIASEIKKQDLKIITLILP